MPSQTQIAKHWGVSQPYVAKLVKKGCPTNSLRAADDWRDANARHRAPSNAQPENWQPGKGRPTKPGARSKPAKTDDSLRDALQNTITIADNAFEAYEDARLAESSAMSARLSEHNKAIDCRLRAERQYREEQERRGLLVLKSEITEICRRCMEAVLTRLKKLPNERGPQSNSPDSLRAVRILEAEVNSIIAIGREAINAL